MLNANTARSGEARDGESNKSELKTDTPSLDRLSATGKSTPMNELFHSPIAALVYAALMNIALQLGFSPEEARASIEETLSKEGA